MEATHTEPNVLNSLVNRRAKLYTKSELTSVQDSFRRQFKFNVPGDLTNTPKNLNEITVKIALASIDSEERRLTSKHGSAVRGIHFDYGIRGRDFCPVIQFMFADPNEKGDLRVFPELYEVIDTSLVEITSRRAEELTSLYTDRIRIFRTDSVDHQEHNEDPAYPDPKAEWFPYADNVNKLVADNQLTQAAKSEPSVQYLMVTCISEKLPYSAMAIVGGGAEFRHMLALFAATADGELLATAEVPANSSYAGLAMDLGFLCPPRCKK